MKFGLSGEEQAFAGGIVRSMIEGQRELEDGVPICYDPDGTPVYRVLLHGMAWKKIVGGYIALDGPNRVFNVMRNGRHWQALFHSSRDTSMGFLKLFQTRREAISHCYDVARRTRWYPGACV